jgi:hypothetical protein
VRQRPLSRHRVSDGHWFTAAKERARDHVLVIERNLARVTDTRVGDRVALSTAGGAAQSGWSASPTTSRRTAPRCSSPLTTVRSLLHESGASTY